MNIKENSENDFLFIFLKYIPFNNLHLATKYSREDNIYGNTVIVSFSIFASELLSEYHFLPWPVRIQNAIYTSDCGVEFFIDSINDLMDFFMNGTSNFIQILWSKQILR